MKILFMIIALAAAALFGSYAHVGYQGYSRVKSAVLAVLAVALLIGGIVLGMQAFTH